MIDWKKPIAVICNDAGAANIIIGLLKYKNVTDLKVFMAGPAKLLWERAFPLIQKKPSINQALDGVEQVITGTGWATDVEHLARVQAKSRKLNCVAVVDHWVNYEARFIRDGYQVLPDEIWLTDDYAMQYAKTCFPGSVLRQIENHYLKEQLSRIKKNQLAVSEELLYVLEPMRDTWGRGQQGEFQALDYFVSYLEFLSLPADIKICLRPHPSESADKYEDWITQHPNLKIFIDDSPDIAEAISRANWVVGCQSFALVLAVMSGKKVYCSLPPWAPKNILPHNDIISLRDFETK